MSTFGDVRILLGLALVLGGMWLAARLAFVPLRTRGSDWLAPGADVGAVVTVPPDEDGEGLPAGMVAGGLAGATGSADRAAAVLAAWGRE